MKFLLKIILPIVFVLSACGDPEIDIASADYEEKIVVEGYVYPGDRVEQIKIFRNFELNINIDVTGIVLSPANGFISGSVNGQPLVYDSRRFTYYVDGMIGEYDKEYTIEIEAEINGKRLFTQSITRTPKEGFHLLEDDLGDLIYRDDIPRTDFKVSQGTDFYLFSIQPQNATYENFIYDNPYIPNLDQEDLEDNFQNFVFQADALINIESADAETIVEKEIRGLDTWFYTDYKVIAYAGDKNFKDYFLTVNQVQEPDGNFIEPEMHFTGDGIGVWGGAIRDSLRFNLLSKN